MQANDQNKKRNNEDIEKELAQQLELSDAWRQLLGLEAQASTSSVSPEAVIDAGGQAHQGDPATLPVLGGDPWNQLALTQGVQVVDLQQAHVHPAQATLKESDVEHALDRMQENRPEK